MQKEINFQFGGSPSIELELGTIDKPAETILTCRAALNREAAIELGLEWCLVNGELPPKTLGKSDAQVTLIDTTVVLIAGTEEISNSFDVVAQKLYGFKVYRVEDARVGIQFKASFYGDFFPVLNFLIANRGLEYKYFLKPRQQELFDGSRVEMSAEGAAEAAEKKRGRGRPKKQEVFESGARVIEIDEVQVAPVEELVTVAVADNDDTPF